MDSNLKRSRCRIVMLANSGHQPTDTRIFQKEARTLAAAGYSVKLIIPTVEGFAKDGVTVQAVKPPKGGWQKLTVAPARVLMAALREPGDSWFHLHDSELLAIGLILRVLGRKVIYDAHEDTPLQISYQHWLPWWMKKPYAWLYRLLEKMAGWFFHAIIVAEPIISRYYAKRKTTLICNYPMLHSFRDMPVLPYGERKKQLVYVGLLSEPRGFSTMVKGAERAMQQINFSFVAGGKFSPASLEKQFPQTKGFRFLDWVAYDQLPALLFESRIGIIIPEPNPRYLTNYPVKLFEYMAAGLPVIASREGEAATFVREANAGLLIDPSRPEEVAEAIATLLSNEPEAEAMGLRGRSLVFEKYNWEKEGEKLVELYDRLNKIS